MKREWIVYISMSIMLWSFFGIGCVERESRPHVLSLHTTDKDKKFLFPTESMRGDASAQQAEQLAEIYVFSHNQMMDELRSIKQIKTSQRSIKESIKKLEVLSAQQGSGEITIFFPTGKYTLPDRSMEYQRVVRFLDYLTRESKGRNILFVSIGCASHTGHNKKYNKYLAKMRAKFPISIIDKYHINTPHEFYFTYGVGEDELIETNSKNNSTTDPLRYQHVRIIAVFKPDQIPTLPQSNEEG